MLDGTLMTRIKRIFADIKIRIYPLSPLHPRSILLY